MCLSCRMVAMGSFALNTVLPAMFVPMGEISVGDCCVIVITAGSASVAVICAKEVLIKSAMLNAIAMLYFKIVFIKRI